MIEYKIYALVDPRNNSIFYVGRTSQALEKRLEQHIDAVAGCSPKDIRIGQILDWGNEPHIVLLQNDILCEKSAFTREVFWIEMFHSVGSHLTNASIDYGGKYFLANYYLTGLDDSDGTVSVGRTHLTAAPNWSINLA